MIIHVVQQGETIRSIAEFYEVSEEALIRDNGLENQYDLVIGQSLIITFPELTYTVKEGDTLLDIAKSHDVSVMQLLQNNPFLSEREYIFPGEILIISFSKKGTITTHGNTVPYINIDTLRKTLPYLTYLSILNYTATDGGDLISYYDDTEIIQLSKEYDTIPLLLLTTLTIQGEANIVTAFDLLLNEDFQNTLIDNLVTTLISKGYYGINISLENVSISNLNLIEDYYTKLSNRLTEEGFLVFATINPNITAVGDELRFTRVDYSPISNLAHSIIFMNYEWANNPNPPSPISSIYLIGEYLDYLMEFIPANNLVIGMATIGYDWELPYSAGISSVYSLPLDRAIDLAHSVGAIIQFDE